MEDVKFLQPDKRTTANGPLIRKAFMYGFKEGIAFMNECDANDNYWWRTKAFKEFCKKNKIKFNAR